MKKIGQRGFAHVEAFIILIVIVLIVAVGFYVFNRVRGNSSKAESVTTARFTDTPAWAKDAITWATSSDIGMMNGFQNGTFKPSDPLLRAQLANALYNYAGKPLPGQKRAGNKLIANQLRVYDGNLSSRDHVLSDVVTITAGPESVWETGPKWHSDPVVGNIMTPEFTKEYIQVPKFVEANWGKRFKVCARARVTEPNKASSVRIVASPDKNRKSEDSSYNTHILNSTNFTDVCNDIEFEDSAKSFISLEFWAFASDYPNEYPFEAPVEVSEMTIQAY